MSAIGKAMAWLGVVTASSAAVLPVAAAPHPDSRAVVAVYPPWWSQARVLDAGATAGPAFPGAASFVVLVQDAGEVVSTRLRRSGAILILNGEVASCLGKESRS